MANGHGGKRPGAGRPKGAPNGDTADIRALVSGALQDVGGRTWLAEQARAQPVAFMSLIARVLPPQLGSEGGGPVLIQIITGVPDPEINVIDPDDPDIPCIHDR